jgi:hypothetical protein
MTKRKINPPRPCEYCGQLLPEGNHGGRKYHRECAILVNQKERKSFKSEREDLHKRKKKPIRQHNPMLYLGRDYVNLKLTGQTRIIEQAK